MSDTTSSAAAIPELDPREAARRAGLRYVTNETLGITRQRRGRGFSYQDAKGRALHTPTERERLQALAIPPAWTDVWICPDARGHLQATGRDAAGRKQYLYHADWRIVRDRAKFDKMISFGEALPRIRASVDRDLRRPNVDRRRVLGTAVRLLERTLVRVGNAAYRKRNESFGLMTLEHRHVELTGSTLCLRFIGKGGRELEVCVTDPRAARAMRRIQELPGHEVFQYVNDDGNVRIIDSGDVNEYLQEVAGDEFSAKDFRTWAATLETTRCLYEAGEGDTKKATRGNLKAAIASAADLLGNTPTVCRASYIHPEVIAAYESGRLNQALERLDRRHLVVEGLQTGEAALLAFLRAVTVTS